MSRLLDKILCVQTFPLYILCLLHRHMHPTCVWCVLTSIEEKEYLNTSTIKHLCDV